MKTVEVKLLGQRFKVRSDEGEQYVQELAQYVSQQLVEVQRNSQAVATHNVALLAALNIADNLFKLREENTQLRKEIRERVRKVLRMIKSTQGEETQE
jgi:cell division protein ZapA